MKNTLIIISAQTLLIVATISGTWLLFLKTHAPGSVEPTTQAEEAEAAKPAKDPVFYAMEPPFIVNLQDGNSLRFLQIQVELMARDQAPIKRLEQYSARVRNDLLLLFGSVTREDLQQPEGKALLQQRTLDALNVVLQEAGEKSPVEAVYFTKFVMQ